MDLYKKALILIALLLSIPGFIAAQDQEPLADELKNMLNSEPFNVGLLLQSTANFSLEEDGFNGGRRFGFGVARLKFNGNVDNHYSYTFQMDFSRQPSVINLAMGYGKTERFQIVAGAQKPDIGLDLQPNPGNTDFIDRARLAGTMLNSREVGVSAQGKLDGFDYNVAVFNGTGLNLNNDDRFMYLAKAGYTVELQNGSSIYFGANGALNTTKNHRVGNTGLFAENRFMYGAFARIESGTFFGAAELLQSTFERGTVSDERITGAYVTLGNRVTEKSDFLARWDHISFDEIDSISNRFLLGWNYQATSVISFQVNALADMRKRSESFGLAGNFQFQF